MAKQGPPEIPKEWRDSVVTVLRSSDRSKIEWTQRARNDWQQFGWEYEAYDAMADALRVDGACGYCIPMSDSEETYEFFFQFKGAKLYGKIGLGVEKIRIKVFSTHPPTRDEL